MAVRWSMIHVTDRAAKYDLECYTWRPDDVRLYRFFLPGTKDQDYFGPDNPIGSAANARDAMLWLNGYVAAYQRIVLGRDKRPTDPAPVSE